MRLVLEQSSSDYQKFVERLPEIFRHVAPQRPLVGEERALQLISEKDHNFHTFSSHIGDFLNWFVSVDTKRSTLELPDQVAICYAKAIGDFANE